MIGYSVMHPLENVKITGDWLKHPSLAKLFDILTDEHGEAMVAGGAVRNSLMGMPVSDIDICTNLVPEEVVTRIEKADEKAVPTGIDHGTITVVLDGSAFEVTTLREDIETDGRHAVVKFGNNWKADAERRDLTINALYCDRDGNVFDFVDGYPDILEKQVRFIGNSEQRIREDSLRILRFFRFFAWYGEGRPDAEGLKACNANKNLLQTLSAERVWMEIKKLLNAPDPGRSLLWMRTTGILGITIPETTKWGIDAIPGLIQLEKQNDWSPDALLRLMGMIRPETDNVLGLSKRLALSNAERDRLEHWTNSSPPFIGDDLKAFETHLYKGNRQGLIDAMQLEAVHLYNREESAKAEEMLARIAHARSWKKPEFPISGKDLIGQGLKEGPEMGDILSALEEKWVKSNFSKTKDDLLGDL
ncbi:MAG: CCA tRNA nucleotidyltransferase [Pseudomonadota bacterium]